MYIIVIDFISDTKMLDKFTQRFTFKRFITVNYGIYTTFIMHIKQKDFAIFFQK